MRRAVIILSVLGAVILIGLIALTAVLTPEGAAPAFAVASGFIKATDRGDDEAALALVSPEISAWIDQNCPDGVSACIAGFTPVEWGGVVDSVYRRSIRDGATAWDVQLITTHEKGQGFSGVCIYVRVEKPAGVPDIRENWQVTRFGGWVSCDEPVAGLEQMRSASNAPHSAP